jgi:hypothetical protein
MKKPFDKFEAIQVLERIAYEEQVKFTALGYKPFMLLGDFEDMSDRGWLGYHVRDSDTITIDTAYWQQSHIFEVLETIQHEMIHMYVDRYHHHEAKYAHGKEFCELYEKITGKRYVHYAEMYTSEDMYASLTEQEQQARELALKLGTFEPPNAK